MQPRVKMCVHRQRGGMPMSTSRLRTVAHHITAAPSAAANAPIEPRQCALGADEPTDAMPPRLLDDAQMKAFVQQGYVQLPITELSPEFHASLDAKAELLNGPHGPGCLHNNIYPSIPELGTVMRGPTVRGALQSGTLDSAWPHAAAVLVLCRASVLRLGSNDAVRPRPS